MKKANPNVTKKLALIAVLALQHARSQHYHYKTKYQTWFFYGFSLQ